MWGNVSTRAGWEKGSWKTSKFNLNLYIYIYKYEFIYIYIYIILVRFIFSAQLWQYFFFCCDKVHPFTEKCGPHCSIELSQRSFSGKKCGKRIKRSPIHCFTSVSQHCCLHTGIRKRSQIALMSGRAESSPTSSKIKSISANHSIFNSSALLCEKRG